MEGQDIPFPMPEVIDNTVPHLRICLSLIPDSTKFNRVKLNTTSLANRYQLKDLTERQQFDVRLQISLRANALNIMTHYDDKGKFVNYIKDREQKLRNLLGCEENPIIFDGDSQIFP